MNRHDLEDAAKALERSGYCLYRPNTSDGANIREYTPVDWQTALVKIMAVTGWIPGPEIADPSLPAAESTTPTKPEGGENDGPE